MVSSKLRRRAAWLAWCAIFFGAVAPAISHLLAAPPDWAWGRICSASGTQGAASGTGSQPSPEVLSDQEQCPFCVLRDLLPFIPTQPGAGIFAATFTGDVPRYIDNGVARARFIWHAYQTRAPPGFS
ncbi:MAG: DUF2946 domain-containing protein [Burkholderiaceae bacterium]|jgi:hypothetical protein|nr:DUF2946 domain-containing protein [Burkholderiaceae bacterium]